MKRLLIVAFALLLLFSGWLGGEMAYRYRIGAIQDDSPQVEQFHYVEVDRTSEAYNRRTGTGPMPRASRATPFHVGWPTTSEP